MGYNLINLVMASLLKLTVIACAEILPIWFEGHISAVVRKPRRIWILISEMMRGWWMFDTCAPTVLKVNLGHISHTSHNLDKYSPKACEVCKWWNVDYFIFLGKEVEKIGHPSRGWWRRPCHLIRIPERRFDIRSTAWDIYASRDSNIKFPPKRWLQSLLTKVGSIVLRSVVQKEMKCHL